MNGKALIYICIALLLWAPLARAQQGFAGMGQAADNFRQPERGTAFEFPRDHGAHPEFQIEWWYLTANLTDASGRDLGVQWTLFRSAMAPEEREGWASPQIWMGHAAITTPVAHHVAERFARGGIGQAGAKADPFVAWIDDWEMTGEMTGQMELRASGPDFAYDLALQARGPLVFHGDAGYSEKSGTGRASYYYSQPFFEVGGTLTLPEGAVGVTGTAWLDREYASQPLAATQVSWDWFSMVFDSGARLMAFQLHDSADATFSQATWIAPDGQTTALPDGALVATALAETQVAGRMVPTRWQVALAEKGVDVTVEAVNPKAWMDTSVSYWEGPVRISGSHTGRGYLEMTGY